jgi:hypothetical protein
MYQEMRIPDMKERSRTARWWVSVAITLGSMPAAAAPPTADQAAVVDRSAADAHIVFVGRVMKTHASSLKQLAATPSTALVRVDQLIDVPPALVGIKGDVVVVQFAQPDAMKQDEEAIFFTTGLLYGEHLAVREIARLPRSVDADAVRKQLQGMRDRQSQAVLRARVTSAALIVTGKVVRIARSRPTARSEHDPELATATVEVTGAIKGAARGQIAIEFSQSGDERWLRSPKLSVGEQAVFLAHSEAQLKLPPGNYVLDPLDVQSIDQAAAIKSLAGGKVP